ncbi:MAG: hypothetical protein ACR2G0_12930 [Chthoniobacterales bacterium]
MRQPLLLALLAIATFFYFHNSSSTTSPQNAAAPSHQTFSHPVAQAAERPAPVIVVAAARSTYEGRWKTGPNAQTDFEPFLPSEQAHWNDNPGYTVVSGRLPRR